MSGASRSLVSKCHGFSFLFSLVSSSTVQVRLEKGVGCADAAAKAMAQPPQSHGRGCWLPTGGADLESSGASPWVVLPYPGVPTPPFAGPAAPVLPGVRLPTMLRPDPTLVRPIPTHVSASSAGGGMWLHGMAGWSIPGMVLLISASKFLVHFHMIHSRHMLQSNHSIFFGKNVNRFRYIFSLEAHIV